MGPKVIPGWPQVSPCERATRRRYSSSAAAAGVFSSSAMFLSSTTEDFTPPDAGDGIGHLHSELGARIGRNDRFLDVVAFLKDFVPRQCTTFAIDDFHRDGALLTGWGIH